MVDPAIATLPTPRRPWKPGTAGKATLHRMVMPGHVCPYGLKAKDLLERQGFQVEDHHLTTKEETEAFKQEHGVPTTPQVWVEGDRIGGYDDLKAWFEGGTEGGGESDGAADDAPTTYQPVIALFAVAALLALAVHAAMGGSTAGGLGDALGWDLIPTFAAIAMTLLALQKLGDVEAFSLMFLNYDLLARRWVRYGSIYPFAELAAGVLMLAGLLPWVSGPVALVIGGIGAASVFQAVYIEKRELKCACVGGDSNVPLGFVSLTENLMMLAMGGWTIARQFLGG